MPWTGGYPGLTPDQAVQQKQNKTGRSDPAELERRLSSEETLLLLREPTFGSQNTHHMVSRLISNFKTVVVCT